MGTSLARSLAYAFTVARVIDPGPLRDSRVERPPVVASQRPNWQCS